MRIAEMRRAKLLIPPGAPFSAGGVNSRVPNVIHLVIAIMVLRALPNFEPGRAQAKSTAVSLVHSVST